MCVTGHLQHSGSLYVVLLRMHSGSIIEHVHATRLCCCSPYVDTFMLLGPRMCLLHSLGGLRLTCFPFTNLLFAPVRENCCGLLQCSLDMPILWRCLVTPLCSYPWACMSWQHALPPSRSPSVMLQDTCFIGVAPGSMQTSSYVCTRQPCDMRLLSAVWSDSCRFA